MNYNLNICFLRCISVLSVIFFHYFQNNNELFANGYIGVDIFFVISGYLVSKAVLKKDYNIRIFLERRFLRVYPSLISVTIFFTIFFSFFLIREDLNNIYITNIYSLSGISNFHFYFKNIEYGASDAFEIPFIHTWSLSIEFQFYLFISIFLTFKIVKKIWVLIFLTIFLYFISKYGDDNQKFFFTHLRLYEFFIGILINYIQPKNLKYFRLPVYFLLIVILVYSGNIYFAKEICLILTTLIIIDNNSKFKIYFLRKAIIFLSNISYSLYLIHYPIIFYLSYVILDFKFSNYINLIIYLFITITASSLNYKFIETKFWKKNVKV